MKRRLLIIVVCLLLGAVVNVAVAWGCGIGIDLFTREPEIGQTFTPEPYARVVKWSSPGGAWIWLGRSDATVFERADPRLQRDVEECGGPQVSFIR